MTEPTVRRLIVMHELETLMFADVKVPPSPSDQPSLSHHFEE
jgi:hypothetical protein